MLRANGLVSQVRRNLMDRNHRLNVYGAALNTTSAPPRSWEVSSTDPVANQIRIDILAASARIDSANSDISKYQAADGAMKTIQNAISDMTAVLKKASDDVTDMRPLNQEYWTLGQKIRTIVSDTEYNGTKLFTGDSSLTSLDIEPALDATVSQNNDQALLDLDSLRHNVAGARTRFATEISNLGHTINSRNDRVAGLEGLEQSITGIGDALEAVLKVTSDMMAQLDAGVTTADRVPTWATSLLSLE